MVEIGGVVVLNNYERNVVQECNIEVHFEIWEKCNWPLSEFEAQGIIKPQKFRTVALSPLQNTREGFEG